MVIQFTILVPLLKKICTSTGQFSHHPEEEFFPSFPARYIFDWKRGYHNVYHLKEMVSIFKEIRLQRFTRHEKSFRGDSTNGKFSRISAENLWDCF